MLRQVLHSFHSDRHQNQELFKFLEALIVYHVPGFDQHPLKALRFLDVESGWVGLAPRPG